jgi:hypothetical protein
MGGVKLKDVLKGKKVGDEWFSIVAEEGTHVWTLKNGWRDDFRKDFGVGLISVTFRGELIEEIKKECRRYNKRAPYYLDDGTMIKQGTVKSKKVKTFTVALEVGSHREVNRYMEEISLNEGITAWDTKQIVISSNDCELLYKVHNPNGTGAVLSFYRLKDGPNESFYPDVLYNTQVNLAKGFCERVVHCTAIPPDKDDLVHGCAIENADIVRRVMMRKMAHSAAH